ncbi:hypothetical protein [Methanobrevibacter filiformis]|uniref:Uncharacterized protein n=1 Tax=Methanobrevibacter filiformis TaxID=55758 RepID=A0A166C6E6_9EURY|nr:hypothetical protein [Methanobrevibacter filiformis]KZX11637.1 hypothetical protein MBFIL_13600 [Methanobrevibacter filiformis]
MGLFSRDKKVKTPEEELVDELVGLTWRSSDNLREVLSNIGQQGALENAVKKVLKNGGTCEEIQRAYDEHLFIFRNKAIEWELFDLENNLNFNEEVIINNLIFHIPNKKCVLSDSREDDQVHYHKYLCKWMEINYNRQDDYHKYTISITVYKNKNLENVLSDFESSNDKLIINDGIFLGYHFGHKIEKKGLIGDSPYCFVFEKDGKIIVISVEGSIENDYGWEDTITRIIC